uniref:Uncharacterized protein n=1 Tax=Arundo donax TaxID=35708 RepID=A0A0A8ZAB4_ARUDO
MYFCGLFELDTYTHTFGSYLCALCYIFFLIFLPNKLV